MNAVDRIAVIEALHMASHNNQVHIEDALDIINDLHDVYGSLPLQKYDVVYVLKQDVNSEELKYSIRSVVENMPFNRIVFYCGCPNDIKPDVYVQFEQVGNGKMAKAKSTFKSIMSNDDLTENIWLFNDDFFIMRPLNSEKPICNGTLYSVIHTIEKSRNRASRYTRKLRETALYLQAQELDTISYESHAPMLVNRKKAQFILDEFPDTIAFRSAYGNYYKIEGQLRPDVKIPRDEQEFDEELDLLSTNDHSFSKGKVGTYIRSCFPNKSKYEV